MHFSPSRIMLPAAAAMFTIVALSAFLIQVDTGETSPVLRPVAVPPEVEMPGTQPLEVPAMEDSRRCFNCHGNYSLAVEPGHNWGGSMMAHASRDPIFWATVAIAEQDFPGSGDLCLRCHTGLGWYDGRSEPSNGSGLAAADADGVTCDICHKMTNPNDQEYLGAQFPPYIANDGGNPPIGYYGTGMLSLWAGGEKHGPYSDAVARHTFLQSQFQRSGDFCGSCHDVSNPVVGDLAHNAGAQPTADPVERSGVPGSPVETKAAFNNFPFMYGIVERTFSENQASAFPTLRMRDYNTLPSELKEGAIEYAYTQALLAGRNGDYADGTPRYFTCQSCHMAPVVGKGCNKNNVPLRNDLPWHDLTGGNYWMPEAIKWLDARGRLLMGGGLGADQIAELNDGAIRAREMLDMSAELEVEDNTLYIINLTGHKLISGYPEGRRMWLNIKWYDAVGNLLREDGQYGSIDVMINGQPTTVDSLIDLHDSNTKVYQAHYAITQEWAQQLLDLGWSPNVPVEFDRYSGDPVYTLGDIAAQDPGTYHETFHFVLNNHVAHDNRIPPFGMDYEKSRQRNILPVPANQYGDPGNGGAYNHWDEFTLHPPTNATRADIALVYQPTSWEYVQFLYLANTGSDPFLATTGKDMLDAWRGTGMAQPFVIETEEWEGSGGGGGRQLGSENENQKLDPQSVQGIHR